jgi:tetratricopeptide (TPR) repeat protein
VFEARGDLSNALVRFRASLAIEEALLAGDPSDSALLRSVASSHDAIGAVLRAQGDLAGAAEEYAAELTIIEQLAAREPANATWQVRLSVSHSHVGDMHAARGNRAGAVDSFARAMSIATALVDRDDQNRRWRRELAVSEVKMSRVLRDADPARAHEHAVRAVRAFEILTAIDASDAGWQRDFAEARHALGMVLLARGDARGAEREARAMLAVTSSLQASPSASQGDRRLESLGHGLRGRALQVLGAASEAGEAWEQARAAIESLARDSRDYLLLVPWVDALRHLDRSRDLAIALDLLRKVGYKPI